jgi:hypothetical protein
VAAPVEIAWSTDVGAEYLIARACGEAERTAAENLSEALGGLPLATTTPRSRMSVKSTDQAARAPALDGR